MQFFGLQEPKERSLADLLCELVQVLGAEVPSHLREIRMDDPASIASDGPSTVEMELSIAIVSF